jgi:hypothetical protein
MSEMRTDLSIIVLTSPGNLSWTKLVQDFSLLSTGSEVILVGSKPQSDLVGSSAKKSDTADRTYWIHAPENRATQLNLALQKCKNQWVWILNSDCRVSSRTLMALEDAIQKHPSAIHYFDLDFTEDGPPIAQINAFGAWLRSRLLGLPFGHQGLCSSKENFEKIGGFDPSLETNEDVQLILQAKLRKIQIRPVSTPLITSGKKYRRQGWAVTTGQELKDSWNKTFPRYFDYLKKRWLG